ncbi:MAG: porin, partial [Comamonas sp.]
MQKIRQVGAFSLLLGAALGAQAQSGPTLFGVVDTGVVSTRIGATRTTSMDSGIILGSRVGFRGNEDLGGGTQALYTLEIGLNNDTGALGQGGLGFGRQAFVGFSNPRFGRLTMGR